MTNQTSKPKFGDFTPNIFPRKVQIELSVKNIQDLANGNEELRLEVERLAQLLNIAL